MSEVDLKNALLAGELVDESEATREVKTHAGVVIVRGLTRAETLRLNGARDVGDLDVAEWEQQMVSTAMVSPKMTADEVARWQAVDKAGGSLGDVTDAIAELSGLSQGADKSRVPGARKRS
jgi:hypothetical protein